MKIFIIGSLNMDLVITAPVMPKKGETVTGGGFITNSGGKGANQAVAAAKLGANAYMVGCVGQNFGNELTQTLCGYGVNIDFVERRENLSSGIAVIIIEDADNRIILDKGANGQVEQTLIDKALSTAQAGDYVVLQMEIPVQSVAYALQKAKEKKLVTVFNPAPAAPLLDGMIRNCDYFIVNQSEAEFYTGQYPADENGAMECAKRLRQMGASKALVTMGEKGSICVDEDGCYRVLAQTVQAVDTTAAGDTYVGAFVTCLSEGKTVEQAMRFASKAAAITVTRKGAQQSIPYRKEIQ